MNRHAPIARWAVLFGLGAGALLLVGLLALRSTDPGGLVLAALAVAGGGLAAGAAISLRLGQRLRAAEEQARQSHALLGTGSLSAPGRYNFPCGRHTRAWRHVEHP